MSVSRPACFYIPQIIFFFFDELTLALSKAVIKLDNLIVKDIAMLVCSGYDKLEEFCDTFNLTNLIKSETH